MIPQLNSHKQIAILLLFACVFFKLSEAQNKWNRTYTEDRPLMVFSSISLQDNSYTASGVTLDKGGQNSFQRALWCKIDSSGNVVEYKTVCDSANKNYALFYNTIIENNNKELVAIGYSYDSIPSVLLIKENKVADSLTVFEYRANAIAYQAYKIICYGADYFIAGVRTSNATNSPDIFLLKIDSSGTKMWEKTYGIPTQNEFCKSLMDLNNGNLMLGSFRSDLNQTHEHSNTWLLEVDTAGTLVRQWLDPNDSTYAAEGLLQTQDGGFIYSTIKKTEQSGNTTSGIATLVKMDSAFNKQWVVSGGFNSIYTSLTDIEELPDGNFIACGQKPIYNGDSTILSGWIVKLSSFGQIIWDRIYTGINAPGVLNFLTDIDILPDGSLIAVGQCQQGDSTPPQVGWFLKLDSNGCEMENCLVGVEETPKENLNTQLQIKPNPFTGNLSLTITNSNSAIGSANIILNNPLGQTVYHQQETNLSSSYTKTIDLSYLPNGVYFVAVEADGERIVKQVVKQ